MPTAKAHQFKIGDRVICRRLPDACNPNLAIADVVKKEDEHWLIIRERLLYWYVLAVDCIPYDDDKFLLYRFMQLTGLEVKWEGEE